MTDATYVCPSCQHKFTSEVALPAGFIMIAPCCQHPSQITDPPGLIKIDVFGVFTAPTVELVAALKAEAIAAVTIRQATTAAQYHGETDKYWPPINMLEAAVYGNILRFVADRDVPAMRELDVEQHGWVMAAVLAQHYQRGLGLLREIADRKTLAAAGSN